MEQQIGLIAEGKAEKEAVVLHTLDQFAQKFRHFVTKIARMDALFEASFSPLASSGKLKIWQTDGAHYLRNSIYGDHVKFLSLFLYCCSVWH